MVIFKLNFMRLLLFIALIFVSVSAYNQTLELKKVSTAGFKEYYFIDESTNLKCGKYLKLDKQTKDTLVSGEYKSDQKTGIWKYYADENNLWMAYDFDKKSIELMPEEISKVDSFWVQIGNSFTFKKVDVSPVYLGSKREIEKIIRANFILPTEVIMQQKWGISIATFIVDENGKMKDFHSDVVTSKEVLTQMEKAFKIIDGVWLPAIMDGKPVDSQIALIYDIRPVGTNFLFKDKPTAITFHYQYDKIKEPKRSVGFEIREVRKEK